MRRLEQWPIGRLAVLSGVISLLVFWGLAIMSVSVRAQPTGAPTYPVYAFANINSNATTQVFTGDGVLHAICVNDAGAADNTASVYDDDDGTSDVIAVIDTVTTAGVCLEYDVDINTGIRVITATGTAGDLTVSYRALR